MRLSAPDELGWSALPGPLVYLLNVKRPNHSPRQWRALQARCDAPAPAWMDERPVHRLSFRFHYDSRAGTVQGERGWGGLGEQGTERVGVGGSRQGGGQGTERGWFPFRK